MRGVSCFKNRRQSKTNRESIILSMKKQCFNNSFHLSQIKFCKFYLVMKGSSSTVTCAKYIKSNIDSVEVLPALTGYGEGFFFFGRQRAIKYVIRWFHFLFMSFALTDVSHKAFRPPLTEQGSSIAEQGQLYHYIRIRLSLPLNSC